MANNKKTSYTRAYNSYMKNARKVNPYSSSSKATQDYYKALTKTLNTQNANTNKYYNASKDAYKATYDTSVGNTNTQYDNSARQAYINYRQNQSGLNEQLSNMGMTGGASETAGLKLTANYGTNIANNEASRNKALAEHKNTYDQAIATNEQNRNKALGDNRLAYNENKLAYDRDRLDKSAEYMMNARETARQRGIDTYNNKANREIAKLERKGYTVKTWTDSRGKLHYGIVGDPTVTSGNVGGSGGGSTKKSSGSGAKTTTTTKKYSPKKYSPKKSTKKKSTPQIAPWNPATTPDKIYTALLGAK